MAWVDQKFSLSVTIMDSGRNISKLSYELTAADNATALTDALVIIGYLEAVCAGATLSYAISQLFTNDTVVVPADSRVQVETKALIIAQDSVNAVKKHTIRIPAPEIDVFLTETGDGQNIVDLEHTDVQDYVNLFSTAGEAYISDGERTADDGWVSGRRVTAKSRRG